MKVVLSGCFILVALIVATPAIAQQATVDVSAVSLTWRTLDRMHGGAPRETAAALLDSALSTPAYQAMFRHYNRSWRPNHLPPDVFKRMILSLQYPGEYRLGENGRADQMLARWQAVYADLATFGVAVREMERIDFPKLVAEGVAEAESWLPAGWTVPHYSLFVIPNGGSPAFAIDSVQGYDFFQIYRGPDGRIDWPEFRRDIAHESHHLGVGAHSRTPEHITPADSVAYQFLTAFLGEGTATKFITGFPGGCVPSLYPERHPPLYTGQGKALWEQYTRDERNLFRRFEQTLGAARAGTISQDSLNREIGSYWLAGHVSPIYFVGSELFGAVYHGLGKEAAFAAMQDLRKLPALYNEAVRKSVPLQGCPVLH